MYLLYYELNIFNLSTIHANFNRFEKLLIRGQQ